VRWGRDWQTVSRQSYAGESRFATRLAVL